MSMFPIASATADGTNAVIFDNIPQTFTHLQLRVFGRSTWTGGNDSNLYVTINSNTTSTNYVAHYLNGDGSSASSGSFTSGLGFWVGRYALPTATAASEIMGCAIVDILDYTNTNKNKTARFLHGQDRNGAGYLGMSSSLFMQTGAITRLDIGADIALSSGSRVDLYGITDSPRTGA